MLRKSTVREAKFSLKFLVRQRCAEGFSSWIKGLMANIKHRNQAAFAASFFQCTTSRFILLHLLGENNPLLAYASTMNPHH
jgi:hypothetical protein